MKFTALISILLVLAVIELDPAHASSRKLKRDTKDKKTKKVKKVKKVKKAKKGKNPSSGYITLDPVIGPGQDGWGPYFGLNVKITDIHSKPQQMMMDLGSSTLAFCDGENLDPKLKPYSKVPNQVQFNEYGRPPEVEYWIGNVYQKDIKLVSDDDMVVMPDVDFATMANHKGMTCGTNPSGTFPKSLKGIAGIAFNRGNLAAVTNYTDVNTFKENGPYQLVDDKVSFLQFLHDNGTPIFGVDWSGKLGKDEGKLFYGDAAKDPEVSPWNEAKVIGPVQAIPKGSKAWNDKDNDGWWQINAKSVTVNGTAFPLPTEDYCTCAKCQRNCIMDTGNNLITFPRSMSFCDDKELQDDMFFKGFDITIANWDGTDEVTLTIKEGSAYKTTTGRNNTVCGDNFVLGFPFWDSYYTVFSDTSDQVSYVPK